MGSIHASNLPIFLLTRYGTCVYILFVWTREEPLFAFLSAGAAAPVGTAAKARIFQPVGQARTSRTHENLFSSTAFWKAPWRPLLLVPRSFRSWPGRCAV